MQKFHRGNLPRYSSGLAGTAGYLWAPKISIMVVVIIIAIIVIVFVVMIMVTTMINEEILVNFTLENENIHP
ncbi:MAG: hypothetical protein KKH04_13835 [Proteobacteria bacterium]|nr:hypothetical protein [Pseudomonadota bacterium]